MLPRALPRHGDAAAGPRAAALSGRPLLVEHLGAAAAALVLPLRRAGDRIGARQPRDAGGAADVTLRGFTIPRTPSGHASLVPAPPWSYVGDFLVIDYWADPEKAVSLLPPGLEPHPDPGRCAAIFVDWQSSSGDGDELLDPARSQYKEFFVVVNALLDGEPVTTCPFIWVDQDFALARGWIQGFTKKLGEVWMTRTYALQTRAAPGLAPGSAFGGTCSARGHRLARGQVTLERVSEGGSLHTPPPIVNGRHFPRLAA